MQKEVLPIQDLSHDLRALGLTAGDGVFVHASLRAVGPVVGGARAVIAALFNVVGAKGVIVMPGFSNDAYFPEDHDRAELTPEEINAIEARVPGFDPATSPAHGMGAIAETFRTWPGTRRSPHPTTSVCANGAGAEQLTAEHPPSWATGADSPFGKLMQRPNTKILLVGVGWNQCTALHTGEFFAAPRRTKRRRFKTGPGNSPWQETLDVADDNNRLFPDVGAAFEGSGAVSLGKLGQADCRLCDYAGLVDFSANWFSTANAASGDRS